MTKVFLGENTKMTVRPSERTRVQRFYRDVLGCKVTSRPGGPDLIQIGDNFYFGVVYEESALSDSDQLKGIWLELRTDDLGRLKQKILDFGIQELSYWDRSHFYFQAPGGQVFRLADAAEDLSQWRGKSHDLRRHAGK